MSLSSPEAVSNLCFKTSIVSSIAFLTSGLSANPPIYPPIVLPIETPNAAPTGPPTAKPIAPPKILPITPPTSSARTLSLISSLETAEAISNTSFHV